MSPTKSEVYSLAVEITRNKSTEQIISRKLQMVYNQKIYKDSRYDVRFHFSTCVISVQWCGNKPHIYLKVHYPSDPQKTPHRKCVDLELKVVY